MLEKLNSDQLIRPYLHEYPFTTKGLQLVISFSDKDFKEPPKEFVSNVSVVKKTVYYSIFDPKQDPYCYIVLHKEPYEEAVRIVNEQNTNYLSDSVIK